LQVVGLQRCDTASDFGRFAVVLLYVLRGIDSSILPHSVNLRFIGSLVSSNLRCVGRFIQLLLLEFIGLFFDISTEETLHAINVHMTTIWFCNESLRDKLPSSFFSFNFFNEGGIDVVGVILLQEALSSNLNKIILIVRIVAAFLNVASLRELLSKV